MRVRVELACLRRELGFELIAERFEQRRRQRERAEGDTDVGDFAERAQHFRGLCMRDLFDLGCAGGAHGDEAVAAEAFGCPLLLACHRPEGA